MRLVSVSRTFLVCALLVPLLAGCGPGGVPRVSLRPEVERPEPGVVLFVCDGMSIDLVREGCRDGWLPNIQRRFVENGVSVREAVGGLPSITYAMLTTFATGVSPATHGIVGNRWFDRRQRLFRNYGVIKHYRDVNEDFEQPTIYEMIRPAVSASIQNAVKRGVTQNFANWAASGTMWFFGDYTAVDKLTATTIERVADWANRRGQWPALLTCYFPGLDSIGHESGPDAGRYRWAVAHADHQIGRVCDWLEREGLSETTYVVLVSDHGMMPVREDGFIPLMSFVVEEWGRQATDRPVQDGSFEQRRRHFDRFDTVVDIISRRAALHFVGPTGWDDVPDPEMVAEILATQPGSRRLWDLPGVDLVAYLSGDDEVTLRAARGAARVVERDGSAGREFQYVPDPDDLFGYLAEPELAEFVAAGFHSSREWLDATAGHEYPDVVPHLGPLLRSPRTGQVLLFAAPGYSFDQEFGGHGGIDRVDLCIPLMLAGPGIEPGGEIDVARAVDLVPTLLALMGIEAPDEVQLDGEALLSTPTSAALTGLRP